MEVIVLEESNNGRDGGMLAPGSSSPSPVELRSCDIVAEVDDKQVEEQCDHFSIRGYVAQVRKRDPKFCSLSQMFHDQQQYGEHSNSFSPLSVTKFRRWDCKNCLDKVNISDNTTAVRTISAKLDDNNNCCSISFIQSRMPINVGWKKLFPCSQQLSGEKNVERLTYLESTTKESNCKCHCSLSSDKEGITEANIDPAKKDLQVSLTNHDGTVNLSSNASMDVMAVSEACQMTNKEERKDTQNPGNPKPSEVILNPNADENEETEEIVIVDCNTNNVSRPISAHKGDQVADKVPHGEYSSKRNIESNCKLKYDKCSSPVDISDVKFRRKKPKKVRLLSDIINIDVVGISRNDLEFDHGKDVDLREDNSSRTQLTLERKDGIHVSHHTAGEVKLKTIKSKKKYKALDVVDDGSSLMNWLRRAHKKLKTGKKNSQHKDVSALAANSKSALDTSASKDMDLNFEQLETGKCKKELTASSIHHVTPYVHFLSPGGSLNKRKMLSTANIQHGDDSIRNNDLKRNISKKGSLFQIGSGKSTQRYLSKVSPGKRDFQNVTGLHEQRIPKKKKKKQRLMQEREVIDDIPMDIVELLAKNQRERLLINDKDAFDITHTRSKISGNRKNHCTLVASEDPRNNVSTGLETNFFQQKSLMLEKKILPGNVGTSVQTTTVHPLKLQNPDHLHYTGQLHTHLHKEGPATIATSSQALLHHKDQHIAGARAQSWSHKGMKKSTWDSFKTASRDPSILPCGAQFRPSTPCIDSTFSHTRPVSSNLITQQPEMATPDNCIKRAMNQGQARSFPTVLSTVEAENICDPRIAGPSVLYANETMPAMHLLRLMDSSKLTGFPLYETPNRNQMELLQVCNLYSAHNQYKGSTSTSYGAESNLNEIVPLTVEGFEQHQHQQNSHKPLRPLPRVGVLGSLLQKEITNWSENCGTQSGYRIGESQGLASFQMKRKENFEALNSGMFSAKWNTLQFGSISSVVHPEFSSAREGVAQSWTKGKGKIAQPLEKILTQDICVTNRNPADFTTISDDNEYMISL